MENRSAKLDRSDFLEYAAVRGRESAADLLLLCGYDGYLQTVEDYDDLMYLLTDGKCGMPLNH